jgi:hypothetical protein
VVDGLFVVVLILQKEIVYVSLLMQPRPKQKQQSKTKEHGSTNNAFDELIKQKQSSKPYPTSTCPSLIKPGVPSLVYAHSSDPMSSSP